MFPSLSPRPPTNHEIQIRLTNSGVPVTVIDSDADELFPTDIISQPALPYTVPVNVVGIVNTEGESDEALFRITITRFTKLNCTSIGACRSHVLCTFSLYLPGSSRCIDKMVSGDATGFLMLFKHLSQLYQGLEPINPAPYHEPGPVIFEEPLTAPSPDGQSGPSSPPLWQPFMMKPMDFVAFRLTATQLTEIHNFVIKGVEGTKTTRTDTVLGLLARCLTEVEPETKPIDTISYVVNVRAFHHPPRVNSTDSS